MSEEVTQKSLIICSPYEEPDAHWVYGDETKRRQQGRRPAGYLRWDAQGDSALVRLDAVNRIRERVAEWRSAGGRGDADGPWNHIGGAAADWQRSATLMP